MPQDVINDVSSVMFKLLFACNGMGLVLMTLTCCVHGENARKR